MNGLPPLFDESLAHPEDTPADIARHKAWLERERLRKPAIEAHYRHKLSEITQSRSDWSEEWESDKEAQRAGVSFDDWLADGFEQVDPDNIDGGAA